jgi:tungstate transport system ATP-binding protein
MGLSVNTSPWLNVDQLGLTENGVRIIDGISLKVSAGRTAILGPNGAGKSTLLRLIHGLLDASEGAVSWPLTLTQGMVFQRPVMLRASVLANVEYGLKLRGVDSPKRRARALEALDRVGLPELADRPARRLSSGEQQRVALARAWALEPQVLLLDEPTSSLDPASSREVERIILDIAHGGTRILLTTHNLGQAKRLAEDVIYLENGRVMEHSSATEFFSVPQSTAAQRFLQEAIP